MYCLIRIYNEKHEVIAEASVPVPEKRFIVKEFYDGLSYQIIENQNALPPALGG